MDRTNRFILSALIFVLLVFLEYKLVEGFISRNLTYQQFEQFLWISFALLFAPLILAGALALMLCGLLLALAYFVARLFWRVTSPNSSSGGSVRAQLEERRDFLRKLQAERSSKS